MYVRPVYIYWIRIQLVWYLARKQLPHVLYEYQVRINLVLIGSCNILAVLIYVPQNKTCGSVRMMIMHSLPVHTAVTAQQQHQQYWLLSEQDEWERTPLPASGSTDTEYS